MKKIIYLILFVVLGLINSCKLEPKGEDKVNSSDKEIDTLFNEDQTPEVKKVLITYVDYLDDFQARKSKLAEQLKTSTPQKANNLYLDFRKENSQMETRLNDMEMKMLEDFEGLYDAKGNISYKKYGTKIRKAEAVGLEFWGVGEGYTEIRERPNTYSKIFSGKVSRDTEKFILLKQQDNEVLIINDAALAIPFIEMADVVLKWEKFIQNYPKSQLKNEAKQLYEKYQIWYLFGLNNTPTREYETGRLYKENRIEMERFVKNYPESPTTKLVKIVLESKANTEELHLKVSSAQMKIVSLM